MMNMQTLTMHFLSELLKMFDDDDDDDDDHHHHHHTLFMCQLGI